MTPSKVSIGGGNFPSSHGDGRGDLGYGRLNPSYHVEKELGNHVYPYRDPSDDLEDVDTGLSEEEEEELWDKMSGPHDYDHAGGHYDPFSFVGSNTLLNGPAAIGETFSPSATMVPKPNMYQGRGKSTIGGMRTGTARGEGSTMAPTIDTGDRWGWSNPLYKEIDTDFESEYNYTLEDIASDEEECLREYIRHLILRTL